MSSHLLIFLLFFAAAILGGIEAYLHRSLLALSITVAWVAFMVAYWPG